VQHQSTSTAQRRARSLRRGMTDAERKLWLGIRQEQLGVKFRRQHPIGIYIADFACLAPKLIIELDGAQHAQQRDYDARRDAFLKSQGFAVLRFATNEPLVNLEGVLIKILETLNTLAGDAPIPAFPQRGKERNTQHAEGKTS
jgi:very-short-patch-repair endonuclease